MRPAIGFKAVIGEGGRGATGPQVPLGRSAQAPAKEGRALLSGATVMAYLAKADMTTPYFIAYPCGDLT